MKRDIGIIIHAARVTNLPYLDVTNLEIFLHIIDSLDNVMAYWE